MKKENSTVGRFRKAVVKWYNKDGRGYLFLFPFFVLFTVFIVAPIIVAAATSLTSYNMIEPAKFIGLVNLRNLFVKDTIFYTALKNTFLFVLVAGPIGYIMSFLLAWIINNIKLRNVFSLAIYAPSITSSVAMTVIWGYFFSSDRYGLINNILINMGIIFQPILWNIDSNTILPVIVIISVWMSMGNGFLVFLAGFKNVPDELYESGRIDGIRNMGQELWYITVPAMKPQMLFGMINSIVSSFAVFDISVAFAGMPSQNYAGHTIVTHLYDYAFIRFEMGYASAIAVVLFLTTFLLGQLAMRLFSEKA